MKSELVEMMTVNSLHQQQRKDAMRALLNIVIVEGFVLVAVVGVYFWSGNFTYLNRRYRWHFVDIRADVFVVV
jgi:hypothetical protein